jgi:chromosome condensin MukBEF complex kleisin-like MukF subunit
MTIKVDLDKAREIQKNRWRAVRHKRFLELDIALIKALESGDTERLEAIKAEKQRLRDITVTTDLTEIVDLEELKDTWPNI